MAELKAVARPVAIPKTYGEPVLTVKNLCFCYTRGGKPMPEHLSLVLRAGEHLCLLGGNGTGKTTLLRLLCGALRPASGKVLLDKSTTAYLPQEVQTLFGEQTVREDMLLYCKQAKKDISLVEQTASRVGVLHLLDRHPYDLSGGEIQLCAMARLLLQDVRVLLLDEPTKGLDAKAKARLQALLCDLTAMGIAILTVTHDVRFAASSADMCAMLFDGRLISPEPTRDFFAQNRFYTTPTSRMTDGVCIMPEDVK